MEINSMSGGTHWSKTWNIYIQIQTPVFTEFLKYNKLNLIS